MSLHAPERQIGESFDAYRARRAQSHKAVARILNGTLTDYRLLGKGPSSTDVERANARARRPARTEPKFSKARIHKQHTHPLRDEHGAYTEVGRNRITEHVPDSIKPYMPRRKWLAGISAQRGY